MAVRRARGAQPSRRKHAQHFLRSTRLAAEIVRNAGVGPDDLVLDIGAGTGALTAELAQYCRCVRAIEIDAALTARLHARFGGAPQVEIVHADALTLPLPGEPFRVVANIPFDATAAICRRLLDDPGVPLERADLIVELGVAQKRARLCPSTALGVYWGAWYEFTVVRRLHPSAFAPPPSVDAAVLRIVRRIEPLVDRTDAPDYRALVAGSFQRRSAVRRALHGVVSSRQLKRLANEHGFSPEAFPWELDQHQWAAVFGFVRRRAVHSPDTNPFKPVPRGRKGVGLSTPASAPAGERVLLDAEALQRTLHRIAHEIIEGNERLDEVALIGIHTRGVFLAQRLRRLIDEFAGAEVALGTVDITFYRDDVQVRGREAPLHPQPLVRATRIDFPLEGRTCVLVDDVLYTGRTIRAAIDALFDYGRPARVQLAVICDRGHRELPIRPDYVGKNLPTARGERVQVELVEVDEVDQVLLVPSPEEGS